MKEHFSLVLLAALMLTLASSPTAFSQGHKECDGISGQIEDAVERVAKNSQKTGHAEARSEPPAYTPETAKGIVENNKAIIRKDKHTIWALLDKLCECCGKKSETTGKAPTTPTPSTTDKVTDILRTIGGSVSVNIGGGMSSGGGHHDRIKGADRTKTAERVPTDKTHKTSPSTTSPKKTVTSACKCHPCTCSPCTCH